jgi:hypothetical protein
LLGTITKVWLKTNLTTQNALIFVIFFAIGNAKKSPKMGWVCFILPQVETWGY